MRERLLAYRAATSSLQALLRSGRRRARRAVPPGQGPVRIVLAHAFGGGGTIRTVLALARRLSEQHEVEIISLLREEERPHFSIPSGCRVVVLEDRRQGVRARALQRFLARVPSLLAHPDDAAYWRLDLWTDLQLLRAVRRMRSGVLMTTRPAFNAFAARFAPGDVVAVAQEHLNLGALTGDLPAEIRRQYRHLDAVAVLTRQDERAYRSFLEGVTPVAQIPNAVPPLPGAPAAEREKVVLAAGRLVDQKGFDLLIRAWAPVARAHPDWRLVIHGTGHRNAELQTLIDELGLAAHAALAGRTAHMGEALSSAAIYALSSRWEGFPMVLLEAMSKGIAIVSFDCPTGPAEAIENGLNGLLVPAEDVDEMSRALCRLIDDEPLRRRLGTAALDTARDYGMSAIGPRWERLLAELTLPVS